MRKHKIENINDLLFNTVARAETYCRKNGILEDSMLAEDITMEYVIQTLDWVKKHNGIYNNPMLYRKCTRAADSIVAKEKQESNNVERMAEYIRICAEDKRTKERAMSAHITLDKKLDTLTEKESQMIRLAFGFDGPRLTFREIGEMYGYSSGTRPAQIVNRGLKKMRHPSRARDLEVYL